jgi:hypothetical protein
MTYVVLKLSFGFVLLLFRSTTVESTGIEGQQRVCMCYCMHDLYLVN